MERVGLELVADGSDKYLATLGQTAKAEEAVADGAKTAAKGIDGLDDAADKGGKGLSFLEQMAVGATRKLGELAVEGAAAAGQAILQFVSDGVHAAGDFEAGMNEFAAVTGGALKDSGHSLEDFSQLFIQLGRDLPVSTSEVQQAAVEMAKGGIEPATLAAGGLKQALQFAAASGLGLADAAEIAAKAVGGWTSISATAEQKAIFLSHSTDLLARAANAATVNVDDLALGLFNSQGSAKAAGASFDEVVTTLAATATSFASSAQAGTALANFMNRLQPRTADAADAFKRLNLLTAEGKSVFYDAQGSFIGMSKAAGILHAATKDLTDAERADLMQTLFGNDAKNTAISLAEQGAEGYNQMAEAIGKQLSVADQAAQRQQGFNTALTNLEGSLEALQITIFTKVLPAFTGVLKLAGEGVNALTNYADATMKGETFLAKLAGTVSDVAIPALTAATGALTAYAIVQGTQALPSILKMLPALALQTEAFFANAGAVALAAAPYVAIAAAIGAATYAYQQYNQQVKDATAQLLDSKSWWQASGQAISDYAGQVDAAKDALAPYAATITELRTEIEADTEALGKHAAAYQQFGAASGYSQEQLDAELAAIVRKKDGLVQVTAAYNTQSQAMLDQASASVSAQAEAEALAGATAGLGQQASLTQEDIEKLGKAIKENFEQGQQAVQAYATSESEFLANVEQRRKAHADKVADLEAQKQKATTAEQKAGFDDQIAAANAAYKDQEGAAADSYARQQAQQQQHLGQMLIDYVVAQNQLGQIATDKAAEITSALEKEYGLQQSSVASTYLKMKGSIDDFADSAGKSTDDLIGHLRDQQHEAANTQKAMDDAFHDRTYEITSNFIDAKGDALDFAHTLETIPKEIHTTVVTDYVERGQQRQGGQVDDTGEGPHRARGGRVDPMHVYTVGERGTELFVPDVPGTIVPHTEMRQAITNLSQFGGNVTNAARYVTVNVDARGSSLTMADIQRGVQAGLRAEGEMAGVRRRAGVA